ncbi:3HB-oligomer hydrolase (3HBOH) [Thermomonospora echinospora]|uniref:3HB-oligomer hydrolase (3HBOH) n=1 Tax=Thermomonospora echinospora TaxID=1992 RepID=A0A1H6CNU4_9ACTN|nr:tannase/feruloyl esterase family alpha/beta hydrolase [Thermomonospora echinospora]SEG74156.1 3HB-oligomer hydrolase (3HBOH) [Thermomonospora echinospora]
MPTIRRLLTGALLGTVVAAPLVAAPAGPASAGSCPEVTVPGAEHQVTACLDDLTTAGTVASGHTVPADYAGLHPAGARNPSGVPGVQIDGYFPDDSTFNTNHGWNHDSQFVIRLPQRWNGGLVVAGTPGNRRQYANDFTISDAVLAQGYAYAATDKGNSGLQFYRDGKRPGDAIAEWNHRVTQLTKAAKKAVKHRYGRAPGRTYVAGTSNGGYLVRWQLENHPELYTGGVDWEGTLWREDGPNLLTFLPPVLAGRPDKTYPAGSSFLWPYHEQVYWDLTQRIYREELDPGYDGATEAGTPYCAPGTPACDADYDYASRPREVRKAVRKISLTGRIGRPMVTLHGTLDALLPIDQDSDVYAAMVRRQGRGTLHRYYRIEGGNHTDGLYDAFPDRLRPLLPCYRSAFTALEAWTTRGVRPPASATIPRPATGDLVNTCALSG